MGTGSGFGTQSKPISRRRPGPDHDRVHEGQEVAGEEEHVILQHLGRHVSTSHRVGEAERQNPETNSKSNTSAPQQMVHRLDVAFLRGVGI